MADQRRKPVKPVKPAADTLARLGRHLDGVEPAFETVPPEERVSDKLAAVAEPFMDPAAGTEQLHLVYSLAIVAWNASLAPITQRRAVVDDFVKTLGQLESAAREMVLEMVARKLERYPEARRAILSFDLDIQGEEYELSVVASTKPIPEIKHRGLMGLE